MKSTILYVVCAMCAVSVHAQTDSTTDTVEKESELEEVVVRSAATTRRMGGAMNGMHITQGELFKAACCNLGESFVTNPSVDVNYQDAATGARQIKLLGLAGTYVQMLTENLPNFRGAAMPYALGYVPGPWMKGIQVSKGSASVKNGYESITGQINVDYLKAEDEQGATINLYGDSKGRMEINADGNVPVSPNLSTEILAHYENNGGHHDDNSDGFLDKPEIKQVNVQNRWKLQTHKYIFHGGIAMLREERTGGQTRHSVSAGQPHYGIGISTDRYEAYLKNAFVLNHERNENIALMATGSLHRQDAQYGVKRYDVNEKNLYASLIYETDFTPEHNLSTGASLNHDYLGQHYRFDKGQMVRSNVKETVPGAYVQYTYNWQHRLVAMAGIRIDHSNLHGTFFTPRVHLKYMPSDVVSFRASAGKGYRTVHALAENNFLMASGRTLVTDDLKQENAWNYGLSTSLNIPVRGKTLMMNVEYYYTHFGNQAVIDYDSNPEVIHIGNLDGKSFSHTFQIDATYPVVKGLTMTAAYRYNDVKTTFGGVLKEKPLTSKYKALLTVSYKTPLEFWQFDATFQLNGGGRMPEPYETGSGRMSWERRFGSFAQLNAQVTRWFRKFSVYVGGENLTGFQQKNPIVAADNPWGKEFESTMIWGPVHGAMLYAGVRIQIGRLL